MSSATHVEMGAFGALIRNVADGHGGSQRTEWQTKAQRRMAYFWRFYRCESYSDRQYDWDGYAIQESDEVSDIARANAVPPGFYEATGATEPLKLRKPSTPYYITRAIVSKFTGLLFSAKRHPKVVCDDPDTEAWLEAFIEQTRLWAHAVRMRNMGGGMGAVGLGFKFVAGKPYIEVHDARTSLPDWEDRVAGVLRALDKRTQYSVKVEEEEIQGGKRVRVEKEKWFWARRLISKTKDQIWQKVPVNEDGTEPDWDSYQCESVDHNFGFCPVVWIVNDPVDEGTEGDPDCFGAFELIEDIDVLLSQASRGVKASCDPTLVVSSEAEFQDLRVGSNNALQVERGGTASYLELDGTSSKAARELADDLEERVLTIVRCYLDRNEGGPAKTALEVEHIYSAMTERADVFREQYGERGIKTLLSMVLQVARTFQTPLPGIDPVSGLPSVNVKKIILPKKRVQLADGTWVYQERSVGTGENIHLRWPDYFTPSLASINQAVQAAGNAYATFRVVDQRNAVEFLSPYLGIENVSAALEAIQAEAPSLLLGGATKAGSLSAAADSLTAPKKPAG